MASPCDSSMPAGAVESQIPGLPSTSIPGFQRQDSAPSEHTKGEDKVEITPTRGDSEVRYTPVSQNGAEGAPDDRPRINPTMDRYLDFCDKTSFKGAVNAYLAACHHPPNWNPWQQMLWGPYRGLY